MQDLLPCQERLVLRDDLPDDEALYWIASGRVKAKRTYEDRKRPGGDVFTPAEMEPEIFLRYLGLVGEREVAHALGLRMESDISRTGDGRHNLTLASGIPVDVITRTVPPNGIYPDVLINVAEPPRRLVIVLVVWVGHPCRPEIPGWTWDSEVRARNQIVRYSRNDSYAYPAWMLEPLETLRQPVPTM